MSGKTQDSLLSGNDLALKMPFVVPKLGQSAPCGFAGVCTYSLAFTLSGRLSCHFPFRMLERLSERFEIPGRHAQGAAQLAPTDHGAFDFPQDFLRPTGRDQGKGGA